MSSRTSSEQESHKHKSSVPTSDLKSVTTRTLHITYNPHLIDRGDLFLSFRQLEGFDLVAFYDKYCFVRFVNGETAAKGLQSQSIPKSGIVSLDAAKHTYEVPYPQPDDGNVQSVALHITHLPSNYSREEMSKIFSIFQGFSEAHFYGKYAYCYFISPHEAMRARHVLRQETNLVVSYAKNPPRLANDSEEKRLGSSYSNSQSNRQFTPTGSSFGHRMHFHRRPSIPRLLIDSNQFSRPAVGETPTSPTLPFPLDDDSISQSLYSPLTQQRSSTSSSLPSSQFSNQNSILSPPLSAGVGFSRSNGSPNGGLVTAHSYEQFNSQFNSLSIQTESGQRNRPKNSWNPMFYGANLNFGIWSEDHPSSL